MKKIIILFILISSFFCLNFTKKMDVVAILPLQDNLSYQETKAFLASFSQEAILENTNNAINSPLGAYIVLAMMLETVDTEYQTDMLNYLQATSLENVRAVSTNIMNTYQKNSLATSFNFVNLSYRNNQFENQYGYNQSIINILKQNYLVKDSYIIDSTPNDIVKTIKQETDNFVTPSASMFNFMLNPDIAQVFFNILYFKDEWSTKFTYKQINKRHFNNIGNSSSNVDMLCDKRSGSYYENELFQYGTLNFKNRCQMNFILPNSDVSIEDCLNEGVIKKILMNEYEIDYAIINYEVPKFDKSFDINLTNLFTKKGLQRIYDANIGQNYIPGLEWSYDLTIQSSRIMLDEEGVRAATTTMSCGAKDTAAPPTEEKYIYLNRPFIYFITTPDDMILFSGTITNL